MEGTGRGQTQSSATLTHISGRTNGWLREGKGGGGDQGHQTQSSATLTHISGGTNGWLREGKGGGGDRGSDPVISHINTHLRWDEQMVKGGEGWWRRQGVQSRSSATLTHISGGTNGWFREGKGGGGDRGFRPGHQPH